MIVSVKSTEVVSPDGAGAADRPLAECFAAAVLAVAGAAVAAGFAVSGLAARLEITQPYDTAIDFTKLADTNEASILRMQTGDAAVFWPEDAHMPSLAPKEPGLVRKAVIKVPVGS